MNKAELRTLFEQYNKRTDLTDQFDGFLLMVESRISTMTRLQENNNQVLLDTSADPIVLPDDFMAVRSISYPQGNAVKYLRAAGWHTIEQFAKAGAYAWWYAIDGLNLIIRPFAGKEFTMSYFAKVPPLIEDTDTNATLNGWPQMYLYGLLAEASRFVQDTETEQAHEQQFLAEIARADNYANEQRWSTVPGMGS